MKKRKKLTKEQVMSITRLSAKLGPTQIAKELNCSEPTVYNWMRKLEKAGHKIIRHKRGPTKLIKK